MPLYALIARELPDLERRERTRPAHLEHMNRLDDVFEHYDIVETKQVYPRQA